MRPILTLILGALLLKCHLVQSQNIADFTSVFPDVQTENFVIPSSHKFQKIVEVGDPLTEGGNMPLRPDFTGYVPISGSSTLGYLSINAENTPGGVSVFDINFNNTNKLWETTSSQAIDFSPVFGTDKNCSGTVTPWNTVISSEESSVYEDLNLDGYNDNGWNVEIDPATKMVIAKHWAMGNFAHENVTIHANERTVFQGSDSNPGYLYKFVANSAGDLSSGLLYVYSGMKNGVGDWVLLQNTTQVDRNSTLTQSATLGGTVFNGVEDVEIGPDGMVYFAVKGERRVYRFQDSDPLTGTTATIETFVGAASYNITHDSGTTLVPWGIGNDNLAFDGQGNLWVFQDGENNYIWVVEYGHTQENRKVKLFGISPLGSEPTGITFSPDYKYLFMSIMHPDATNTASQVDAEGTTIEFNKGITMVLALNENLGETLSVVDIENPENKYSLIPNPAYTFNEIIIKGPFINNVKLFSLQGKLLLEKPYNGLSEASLKLQDVKAGLYFFTINNQQIIKLIIK